MKKIIAILTLSLISLQASSYTTTERGRVTTSKPIYKTITKTIPVQECWDEQVQVKRHNTHGYRNSSNPFGTLIGGVAGGILGNQVGKGRGKTVATIGGALIGTMVGHNLSQREYRRDSYTNYTPRYETRQRCTTTYSESVEEKFMGYKNIAHYKGQKIVKVSHKKLRFIPIQRTINY
jgi:uncharacterized protein YcfJ